MLCRRIFVYCFLILIAGSAISDEKDRGTLDFLLSSMLSHREIILGKFAARMAVVLSVIAAGLPVLTFSTLFGSVDMQTLLGGYIIAVMTALSMGAHSVLLCLRRESLRAALLTIYTRLAFYTVGGLACEDRTKTDFNWANTEEKTLGTSRASRFSRVNRTIFAS